MQDKKECVTLEFIAWLTGCEQEGEQLCLAPQNPAPKYLWGKPTSLVQLAQTTPYFLFGVWEPCVMIYQKSPFEQLHKWSSKFTRILFKWDIGLLSLRLRTANSMKHFPRRFAFWMFSKISNELGLFWGRLLFKKKPQIWEIFGDFAFSILPSSSSLWFDGLLLPRLQGGMELLDAPSWGHTWHEWCHIFKFTILKKRTCVKFS